MKTDQIEKKIGVLLINLGTPLSPRSIDVLKYLNEFLTDSRVIDIPWVKRQLLVRGIIVPFRFRQSAKQYQSLWTDRGSPLFYHGLDVKNKLQRKLGESYQVSLAMRYQSPSIEKGLQELKKAQVNQIIILPLFPQYASATTGSVHQKVMQSLKHWLAIPKLTFINSFYDHPEMIDAFCKRVLEHSLENYDHVLFSFHGLPERHIRRIDDNNYCLKEGCCAQMCQSNQFCYKAQCYATARAIAKQLQLNSDSYTVCFQSRLGKEPWLKPYANDIIHSYAKKFKRILVLSPAFICDCLETLYEIAYEYKKEFIELGGEEFQLVTGLNDHPRWIDALASIVKDH